MNIYGIWGIWNLEDDFNKLVTKDGSTELRDKNKKQLTAHSRPAGW